MAKANNNIKRVNETDGKFHGELITKRAKPHHHYSQGDTGYVPQGVGTNPYTDGRKRR